MTKRRMEHGPEEPAVEADVVSSDPAPPSEAAAADAGTAAPGFEPEPPAEAGATADEPGPETTEENEVEAMRRELEQARAQAAGSLDDARRIKAEFENYRKRMLKEQTALASGASQRLIEQILPVVDDFELALLAADHAKDDHFVRGVEMVYGALLDALRKEGLEKIDAAGKPFDPEQHEAMMEIPGPNPEGDLTVAEVVRSGYTLQGRVIRPARVTVVRK